MAAWLRRVPELVGATPLLDETPELFEIFVCANELRQSFFD